MKERTKVTRREAREHLQQLNLACELARLIRHFFPDLVPLLRELPDLRHQSYVTYPSIVLLMTRILSSIFYISNMRKTSEEFNSDIMIENIHALCGTDTANTQLPYWETINRYLKNVDPEGLQDILCQLCSRAFENARIRGKYWQVIIDGTQLYGTKNELDGKSMYRIHNKGTTDEYRENYYYVLEAKLVLHEKIIVSIMTEFVDNENGEESGKQDCERKACWRLMKRLKEKFPMLRICVSADSLYACESFFKECGDRKWHYILRFKEGSIPTVASKYKKLKKIEKNYTETAVTDGKTWTDYVTDIDYKEYRINVAEYGEQREYEIKRQSREQKHRRLLESFKGTRLKEKTADLEKRFQIRLT